MVDIMLFTKIFILFGSYLITWTNFWYHVNTTIFKNMLEFSDLLYKLLAQYIWVSLSGCI